MWKKIVITCIISIIFSRVYSQDLQLANEYYQKGEFEKAVKIYKELANNGKNEEIFSNYVECLYKTDDYNALKRYLKNLTNNYPDKLSYRIEYILFFKKQDKKQKANQLFDDFVNNIAHNSYKVQRAADYFRVKNYKDFAERLFLISREKNPDPNAYALELAKIYREKDEPEKMVKELVKYTDNTGNFDKIKNTLQNFLKEEETFNLYKDNLIQKVQKKPEERLYNDLLVWLYIQKGSYNQAFLQAKALDKRFNTNGKKSLHVGKISLKNNEYETAKEIFKYIINEYPDDIYYSVSKKYLIKTKEEIVKNKYPVNKQEIISLIKDYRELLNEFRKPSRKAGTYKDMASLFAFYLGRKDTAITLLQSALNMNSLDKHKEAEIKLELADIYLLDGKPWESELLYYQVEKSFKGSSLGDKAKLKNARLSYFRGNFKLAKEHLDVLKEGTSRKIANDAMKLSLLIKDNLGLDSTKDALMAYSEAELLLFQHQYQKANRLLDSLKEAIPDHSLIDEIYWLKAKIYEETAEYQKAIDLLSKIIAEHSKDILTDDACFKMAKIYEEKLNNPEKAKDYYKKILIDFKGSIYVYQARKNFQKLRNTVQN